MLPPWEAIRRAHQPRIFGRKTCCACQSSLWDKLSSEALALMYAATIPERPLPRMMSPWLTLGLEFSVTMFRTSCSCHFYGALGGSASLRYPKST